jgi:tryptophanyl-tRNA synthetase
MRVFSAVRPSGELQIGNYFGAIKQWIDLQQQANCVFAVADYHAITTDFDPKTLKARQQDYLAWFLAAGLDPKKSIIFIQSQNPDHTELAWIFSAITKEAELKRMTQYKDKKEEQEKITASLLTYPVLQAADILLYNTDTVPVGEDQVQHIEFSRTLAKRFNNRFAKVFVEPKPQLVEEGARIMSLNNPKNKMSKSGTDKSKISLADSSKDAEKKIMSAVTDSGSEIKQAKDKPAITNLINIYHLLSNKPVKEIEASFKGKGYDEFKAELVKQITSFLTELQAKKAEIEKQDLVSETTKKGLEQAQQISNKVLIEAKKAIGVL